MKPSRATALTIRQGFLLAAAYGVTGKLGLMLALPPGYVSAIFPGAGVAVAAAQMRGNAVLPWVFLGALALNFWVGGFQFSGVTLLAAVGIAIGSCLQACLGGWLLRRALGPEPAIDSAHQVALYLALAPIICLVSATVSVGSLVALGIIAADHSLSRWVAWWIGDSLGLVTVLPLAWVLFGRPRALWRNRRLAVTSAMLAALVFVVSAYVLASKKEQENNTLAFHLQAQQFADHIQDALNDHSSMLIQLDAFMSLYEHRPVSRVEFSQYVRPTLVRFPHLQAIEWVPLVGEWRREAFEREQRADQPRFAIWERDSVGSMVSAAQRDEYFPVTYIAPEFGNQSALGFDLGSNAARRAAVLEALASEPPVATAPIRLVQEEGEQAGILLLHKVSAGKSGPGLVLVVIRVGDFLDAYIPKDVDLRIRLTDTEQGEIIYGRPSRKDSTSPPAYSRTLSFGGRTYHLEMDPGPELLANQLAIQSWGVLVGGLVGIGLLGGVLLLMTGQTARVQALVAERTQALASEQQRLSDFSNSSADWFWEMDANLRYTYFSENFFSAFGVDPNTVMGLTRPELLARDRLNPPDLIAAHVAQIQRGEPFRNFQYRIHDETGVMRWISVSGIPITDADGHFAGYRGTGRVVTAEKNAEEALRLNEQRYRGLYESLSDAFGAVDMSGRMVEWNHAFLEMIGYTDEEVRSLTYQQLTPLRWHAVDEKVVAEQVLPLGHSGVYEKEYIHKDGHTFAVELRVFLIRGESGEPVGMTAIVRDISARKALEAELADYRDNLEKLVETRTADLQIAKEAAEAASRAKSAFLTIASHELRTPMHGIMGTITLAARRTEDPKTKDFLDKALRASRQLMAIINDVLDLSRIESDRLNLSTTRFTVGDLLDQLQNTLGANFTAKNLALTLNADPALQDQGYLGDPTRLSQVLMNLVGNAIKFTAEGGVTVSARDVAKQGDTTRLRFEVRDTGIGIHSADLDRIFQPFEQADSSTTRKYGGTGLGLTLCKRLVDAMGGQIGVESTLGVGSLFWFEIPAKPAGKAISRPLIPLTTPSS